MRHRPIPISLRHRPAYSRMTVPTGRRRPNAMLVAVVPPRLLPAASCPSGQSHAGPKRPMIASRPQMDPSPLSPSRSVSNAGRSWAPSRSTAAPDRNRGRGRRPPTACIGAAAMRALCATARRSGRRPQSGLAGAIVGTRSRATAIRDGARRGAQAIDCAFWDLAAKRPAAGAQAHRASRAETAHHRLYDLAAAPDAMARAAGRRSCALQVKLGGGQTIARGSFGARAARRQLIVDQRRLDGGRSRPQSRRLRTSRRYAGRAAAARRSRRCAVAHDAAAAGLRRRERTRGSFARRAGRQVRRRQHQARQGRRPDRGTGHGKRSRAPRLRHHGRLHGGDLARDGASDRGATRARGRPRRALLLARDRPDGLRYGRASCTPPTPALWGDGGPGRPYCHLSSVV